MATATKSAKPPAKTAPAWSIDRIDQGAKSEGNVFEIRIPFRANSEWEQWALLTADRHLDNPKSDRRMQIAHLQQARERGAFVMDFGDFFCAMQGKFDKRSCKKDVRPEDNNSRYLDSIVENNAAFIGEYADLFALIAEGNHETAIKKRHETDLTERLVGVLNTQHGGRIFNGKYGGFVIFKFNAFSKTSGERTQTRLLNLQYVHGWGGGGPVTRGVIQTNRRAVYMPDAQIVVSGHVHESWMVELERLRVSQSGRIFNETQTHLCIPSYKDDFGHGSGGWHIETGKPPKTIGAYWIRFYYSNRAERIEYEITRAK